jgi:hypothetical protein
VVGEVVIGSSPGRPIQSNILFPGVVCSVGIKLNSFPYLLFYSQCRGGCESRVAPTGDTTIAVATSW